MRDTIEQIITLIDSGIHESPDQNILWGNIIKDGYDTQVDSYRELLYDSSNWLDKYRAELISETSISSLKIKYTNVSGYFIEVPKSQTTHIPDTFTHKQTLVNAGRYVTQELAEFEKKRMEAEGKMSEREYEIFSEIRQKILDSGQFIRQYAKKIWEIDCQTWLAQLAYTSSYVKPEISLWYDLHVFWWRHPVIETMTSEFISNDLSLWEKDFTHIITWPNMWGKSTFLRQNALIILLAHIWSYIPARKATIPLTDKIFSRIWASDNLYLWQSTFMVEMQEVANILNNSTKKSFVIIDEVGRGTSTYDGMSIAWSILKENHDNIQAKTLFSTHYHELCDEAKLLPWVKNFSVAVGENSENVIFLRKIIPGTIHKSYGIEVARLAGINARILKEAEKILKKFQSQSQHQLQLDVRQDFIDVQESSKKQDIIKKAEKLELDTMTPFDALMFLKEIQEDIKNL